MSEQPANNVLLSGPPGCGKTTVVCRLIEWLDDLRLAGFYTRELREHGQRVGFEAVGLSGGKAILAHAQNRSRLRVGRYGVDPKQLRPLIQEELIRPDDQVDVFLIDEIGKMELLCPAFVEAVPRLLDGPVLVVATVALKGQGLIAQVKARQDVRLIQVTGQNRDQLPAQLEQEIRAALHTR